MDHVINSLRNWLDIFEESHSDGWRDEKAIRCIKRAIKELNKYYSEDKPLAPPNEDGCKP